MKDNEMSFYVDFKMFPTTLTNLAHVNELMQGCNDVTM